MSRNWLQLLKLLPDANVRTPELEGARSQLKSLLAACAGKGLDNLYARFGGLSGAFFPHGWGDLGVVNFEEDLKLIQTWPPADLKVPTEPCAALLLS